VEKELKTPQVISDHSEMKECVKVITSKTTNNGIKSSAYRKRQRFHFLSEGLWSSSRLWREKGCAM